METKFKSFKHFNKFKYPYKNYKYQVNKSKEGVKESDVKDTHALVKVSDKLADPSKAGSDNLTWQEDFQKLKTNLISMIELKTKYYIDQRMGILINGNSLYTRGYCSLNILDDFSHGGKSLVYKNNGNPVVTMTQDGYIYCKNIFLNGLNVYEMFQRIFNDFTEGGSIYVKHIDLKNGLYDMDINSSIMKYLKVQPDVNNYLEVFKDNNNAMVMNTNTTVGYTMFNQNMANGNTIYGLRFGKDSNTGANIRYTYSTTANNSFLAMGPINRADTLNVYYDRRVIINTANNLSQCLVCKYNGNLSNNQYLRIGCGDNRDTGIFAYGRNNNSNYLYLKLQGRSASVAVYSNYTSFDANDYILCNVTKKNSNVLQLLTSQTLSNNDYIRFLISDNANGKANIDLMHDSQYYGLSLKIDTADNTNDNKLCIWPTGVTIDGKLDAYNDAVIWGNLEVGKNITMQDTYILYTNHIQPIPNTGNDIYMTGRIYDTDGAITILDNTINTGVWKNLFTIGKWYGTNNIALAYYYDENTPRNCGWKLNHTNAGLLLGGDGYTTTTYTSTFNHLANASNVTHRIGKDTTNCLTILHNIDYSTNPVTFKLTRYNQAETDMLKLYGTTIEVPNGNNLKLNNTSISTVAKGDDVNDNSKINDNTIATTAYIKNATTNTSIHQEIPNNPYTSIAITDNPYLKWSVCNIGNYNTNTDAVCYSEELHQFVIVGNNGYTYFSYDGVTWMSNSMNSFTWTGVVYGPTYGYITCTSSNMFLLSSTDGRTWVPHNNVSPTTGRAITYGNGYYAIVPDGTYASYLAYTTNPTIATGWGSFWLGSTGKWYNIAYSKSQHKFLVVGASGKYVLFDDEFSSGSRITGQLTGVTDDCHGVCYSDKLNLWIIACDNHQYCYTSSDGNTFTQHALPYQTSWHRVIWGNDRFIMTSNGSSSAAYSLDGTNWYPFDISTIGAYSNWLGLTYGNGLFVLSGNNNTVPLNALVATYTLPNSYITPRAMMLSIYPIGSIYISMINVNPGAIFGGSWTEIQNRFLYAVPTTLNSGDTGGSDRHNHPLSDNGYACIATHGAGNIVVRERSTPAWPSNYRMTTGTYGTAPDTDSWGQCLRGFTDNASSLPPYVTVYAWYRYA